ncbi:transposase, partial [Micromonospora sp. ATA32]|nr:transposase [Micromonospora sp. ATA32]
LARALIDAAPATLRRHLGYKTGWYGSVLYVADRRYPSSKTCSGCQTVKPKLSLAERTFNCTTADCPWTGTSTPHVILPASFGTSTWSCWATQKQDVEPT